MNVLKFKKLIESAKVPNKATSGSNGFDLTATSKEWHDEFQAFVYGTGIGSSKKEAEQDAAKKALNKLAIQFVNTIILVI